MRPVNFYAKRLNSIHLVQLSLPAEFTVKEYEAARKAAGKDKYLTFESLRNTYTLNRSRTETFKIPVPEKSRGLYTYNGLLNDKNEPCRLVDYYNYQRNAPYARLAETFYNNGRPLHVDCIDIEEFEVKRHYYTLDKDMVSQQLENFKTWVERDTEKAKKANEKAKKAAKKAQKRYEDFQMLAEALG